MATEIIPVHQWTNGGKEVLVLRFCGHDGASSHEFKYPLLVGAEAICPDWKPTPECGNGLHGWPWGLSMGDGKNPEWNELWQVYGVDPKEVVFLNGKVKFSRGILRFSGAWNKATEFVLDGQIAWVHQSARGSAAATGERGSAAATGERGSAAATGESGSAAATGWRGSAAATGESGSAAATGERGSAAATGWRGSAAATGERGSAAATGALSIAASTGEGSRVEAGQDGIAASTAREVTWIARTGSIFVQSIPGLYVCVTALELEAVDGERIEWKDCKIVGRVKP